MEKQAKKSALVHTRYSNQSPSFRRPAGYVSLSRLWLKYHLPPGARFQCIYIYIHTYKTNTYVKVMCAHLSSPLKWKLLPHWSHDRPAKAGTCKHAEKMCGILHLHHVLLMSQQARGDYRYLLGDNFGRGQIVENRVMDKSSHECISMKYNHITHASDIVHAIQHPPAGT